MVSTFAILAALMAIVAVALGGAYSAGMLDPIIEQIGIYLFKAQAKAEEKKLEAQGLKMGEDFVPEDLKGNKKADSVMEGGMNDLKKNF